MKLLPAALASHFGLAASARAPRPSDHASRRCFDEALAAAQRRLGLSP